MKDSHQQLSSKGLHKRYGKRWVVRDVDLNVNKGEIVGLLGPNGAGISAEPIGDWVPVSRTIHFWEAHSGG